MWIRCLHRLLQGLFSKHLVFYGMEVYSELSVYLCGFGDGENCMYLSLLLLTLSLQFGFRILT